jgi:hypothetical protein
MENEASGAGDVHERHDLRAHGENQVGLVMHSVRDVQSLPKASWPRYELWILTHSGARYF